MKSPRRFHIYNVGIAKTGTTSLGLMFKRYRAGHEFMFQETCEHIVAFKDQLITKDEFREFVLYREEKGNLEMDSASFNHQYLDILLEEFPRAKFVFTIRDCYSWLNSLLNMSARFGACTPEWRRKYGRTFGIEVEAGELDSVESAVRRHPERFAALLKYWGESNARILAQLPVERTLIVRTSEISSSLRELGGFAGVDPSTLIKGFIHWNRGENEIDFLRILDRDALEGAADQHCGAVMRAWFPGVTLGSFLHRDGSVN